MSDFAEQPDAPTAATPDRVAELRAQLQAQPQDTPPAQPAAAAPTTPAPAAAPAPGAQPTQPQAQAPDYAAYLAEQFGVNDPAAIKERLAAAERVAELEKNQRTEADLKIQQWIAEKPQEAMEYFRLQSADFDAMPGKDVMFEAFQRSAEVEGLPADVVRTLFEADYQSKYGVLDFADDPDQADAVKIAQARHTQAERVARATMNGVKAGAKLPEAPAAPQVQGKTPEQQAAENAAAEQALAAFYESGAKISLKTGDLAYDLAVTDRDAFENALNVIPAIEQLIFPNGQYDQAAHFRVAALLSQDPAAAALAAYKATAPAAVPVATLTNPPQAAPAAAAEDRAALLSAIRTASQAKAFNL